MGYLSDQVLAITHAFSDQPRKNGIRELAAKVEAVEQHAKELDYKLGLALHDSEQGIADANESEACLKAENAALREKLAVATQGLQRIKAKTTNVMAMVWSEETLKKLGVE